MKQEKWLGENNIIGLNIWTNKYQYNNETFDEWLERVSLGNPDLKQLILDKKFLFGGRTLSNVGTGGKESFFNCYSRGYVEDNLTDILQAVSDIGLTFKAQGGQGLSLSKIRPKGTSIGDRYQADGIIPFMKLYNTATESISQGGHRRGALMMSLDCWHKEIEDFIDIKTKENSIEKANLSVEIDDAFMQIVQDDFNYNEETIVDIQQSYNGHPVEHRIIPKQVFRKICENAHDWAEPGVLFVDKLRHYNLMQCVPGYEIETTNPCGEQPLPKHFSCNLGSLNLSAFVEFPFTPDARFNFPAFDDAVAIAVEALDQLIDLNADNHALAEQRENSLNYRNIGLGVFGYADMLMELGLPYGTPEARELTDTIFSFMLFSALLASCDLARKKGAFPAYDGRVLDSEIILNLQNGLGVNEELYEALINQIKIYGLRNCSLLSVAPTGSIATMMGMSGGCEPHFALKYTRTTKSLTGDEDKHFDIYIETLNRYFEKAQTTELPSWAVTSSDISYEDRILTQSIMQKYVDTAISSTINLPKETTVEQVEDLYLKAWRAGLKGVTIFREGGSREAILNKKSEATEAPDTSDERVEYPPLSLRRGQVIEVNNDIIGKKRKLVTGCGTLHCTAFFNNTTGELVETYFSKGSTGGCNNFMISLSRMISLAARGGISIYDIYDQLMSCGVCASYAVRGATKKDTSKGASCPIAIGYALLDMYTEMAYELELEKELLGAKIRTPNPSKLKEKMILAIEKDEEAGDCIGNCAKCVEQHQEPQGTRQPKCPECGEILYFEGGCDSCKACGYSTCS